jgi:hypothetical protein
LKRDQRLLLTAVFAEWIVPVADRADRRAPTPSEVVRMMSGLDEYRGSGLFPPTVFVAEQKLRAVGRRIEAQSGIPLPNDPGLTFNQRLAIWCERHMSTAWFDADLARRLLATRADPPARRAEAAMPVPDGGTHQTPRVADAPEWLEVQLVGQVTEPAPLLEPLLGQVSQALDDGVFDDDILVRHTVERDRDYLRAELYENPDDLDAAILVATSQRLLRLMSRTLAGEHRARLLDLLDATGDPSDPAGPAAAVDILTEALATSDGFDPGPISTRQWLLTQLGWYRHLLPNTIRSIPDVLRESHPFVIGVSSGVIAILHELGLSGLPAVLLGTYVGLLSKAWLPKASSPDG